MRWRPASRSSARRLGALRAFFEERAAAEVFRLQDEESLKIDAALAAEGATLALLDALERAGPYGAGHPPPVFALPRHRLVDARPVGTGHLRADLRSASGGRIQAMAFRAVEPRLAISCSRARGTTVHVAGVAVGKLLEWQPHRAVPHHRCGAGLA